MRARKKKKKKDSERSSDSDNDFQPDPLVEGDNKTFDQERIFTSGKDTIKYSFREHFLYFPWENKKSKYYNVNVPPAAFHLEKRSDLKNFDFFSFRKNRSSVNLYRFALERKLCDDLLEYISDNLEIEARKLFKQQLEELRNSKVLPIENKSDYSPIVPLFPPKPVTTWRRNIVRRKPDNSNEVMEWLNNLKIDPLIQELDDEEKSIFFITQKQTNNISYENVLDNLIGNKNVMLDFSSNDDIFIIRKFIRHLISDGFQRKATRFKIAVCSPPGFGKTYLRDLFSGYQIVDLDDLTFFDAHESKIFHKLMNNRDWNGMRKEYHRVINSRFKSGILLCQNSDQIPEEIPFLHFFGKDLKFKYKDWTKRGIFDIIKNNSNVIYIHSVELRNKLIQIIFEELFNSKNYF